MLNRIQKTIMEDLEKSPDRSVMTKDYPKTYDTVEAICGLVNCKLARLDQPAGTLHLIGVTQWRTLEGKRSWKAHALAGRRIKAVKAVKDLDRSQSLATAIKTVDDFVADHIEQERKTNEQATT